MIEHRYVHEALATEDGVPKEFRILTILPGNDKSKDDVQCEISKRPLVLGKDPSPDQYEALSWTWGTKSPYLVPITIVDQITEIKKPLTILPNLFSALKSLRYKDRKRHMWVDYICIDQNNPAEKNLQVKYIGAIYGKAQNVCVWLGDHYEDSQTAMQFIKHKVNDLGSFRQITEEVDSLTEWTALAALMDRPWFSRRWVVQELALAKEATVHCSSMMVTWTEFETAVSLLERTAQHLSGTFKKTDHNGHDPEVLREIKNMGATRLVELRGNLFRFDQAGEILERRLTLTDLVSELWSFEAQEPHDLIYAVLSLAKDAHVHATLDPQEVDAWNEWDYTNIVLMADRYEADKLFEVNYERPYFDLYKDFLRYTITGTEEHNLDIILRPWAPTMDALPSWIPQLSMAAFRREFVKPKLVGSHHIKRTNPDPLVGHSTNGKRSSHYNASGMTKARDEDWKLSDDPNDTELIIRGFVLDTIKEIEDVSPFGSVTEQWLKLGGYDAEKEDGQANEALWRTLVADRGEDGSNVRGYYRKAFVQSIHDSDSGIQTEKLKNRGHPILVEFLRRVEAVVTNRRLFRSARERQLGLAPRGAATNDYVCIFRGMSVPIVLRPVHLGSSCHYVVIGECYLHTMMDGRAIEVGADRLARLRAQLDATAIKRIEMSMTQEEDSPHARRGSEAPSDREVAEREYKLLMTHYFILK